MSGSPDTNATPRLPRALVRRKRAFSLFWLIPIVCGAIGLYLVITTLADRGPLITITFKTANGISAQQTQVEHKSVALGIVEDVKLSRDMSHVAVHVRMNRQGERVLTSNARFWVVRPRFSTGSISGLETLVSGAYIEVDPGAPGGAPQTKFTGLEEPPGKRSDEPGRTYVLHASRLGSLGPGAPVFYRDVNVGEVLSYDLGTGLGPVTINVFVREPFSRFVHDNTHFWNTSGISIGVGPEGFHVELESIQALLSGGVAFETPTKTLAQESQENALFTLYDNKSQADSAGFRENIPIVTYFRSSIAGLVRGSPVEIFGIQIGAVTDVSLVMEPGGQYPRARVAFELQPERVFPDNQLGGVSRAHTIVASLVAQGMRAVMESSNFITGQKDISLQFVPNAGAGSLGQEGNAFVMPSQSGGLDNITTSLSDIATKLDAIPFDKIGANLNDALASINGVVSGPDLRNALRKLSETLTDVQHLVHSTDKGIQPLLQRLPQISAELQRAVAHANDALGENGYGGNSDFQRNLMNLLDQVNDAARSIRLLADFLDRHPEALIRGRTAQATER
jgi:paraquat-inducible protein B